MKYIFYLSILIACFIFVPTIQASDNSSQKLHDECHKLENAPSDPKALLSDVYCTAYIDGVVDGYRITTDLKPEDRFICLPSTGISTDAVINIFSKWLKNNPKNNNIPSRSGVLLSLKAAFPCK